LLTPVQMDRARIIALREDLPQILQTLHEAGVMQLEQVERRPTEGFGEPTPPELQRRVADEAFRFEGLVTALPPVPVKERYHFEDIEDVLAKADQLTIDGEVRDLKTQLEGVDVKLARNKEYVQALERIVSFPKDLSVLTASRLLSGFYAVPKDGFPQFRDEIHSISGDGIVESYHSADGDVMALVALPRSVEEQAKPVFEKYKALKVDLPYDLGSPAQAKQRLESENATLAKAKAEAEAGLKGISQQHYGMVLAIREALSIEGQRHEAMGKLAQSDRAVLLEGWVPHTRVASLEQDLSKAASGRVVVAKVEGHPDDAPTLMQHSSRVRPFEFLVRFFSLPKSEEIDPTLTFSIVFPIFFGLMVGDVGYGLVILLLGLYFMRIGTGKMSARALPQAIRSFGRGMMSKRTIGTVGKIMMIGGVSAMVFGVLFNEYFGAALPWYGAVLSVVAQLPILLVITIFIGLGHITLGYIFGIYLGIKTGHLKHAVGKVGWLGFMWSGTVGLVDFFDRGLFPSPVLAAYGSIAALVGSAVVVAISEGPRFAMEIPTLMSHVMSYARILGVLLASVLLASIVDTSLAASAGRAPITATIFVVVIALMVHGLNIVLGIFEPSIQGVRLHYVEFYTKFFEGNGKPFSPFAVRKRYTK
jgi:V/A-type H+/Na+-transporting ATPase subunit I